LLVILLILRDFRLVTPGAADVLKLAAVGMVVHALLPLRFRLPFFAALSVIGLLWVMGPTAGGAVLVIGLGLIGLAHLPARFAVRVAALVGAGLLLFLLRGRWLAWVTWPPLAAVWPIVGSMFMFRLIVYVYDRRHDPQPATAASTLAYFFMLPNVAFPFFPVVDYRTFRRTHYDRDDAEIYQTGIAWMLRGAFHLILYRVVYYYLTLSPSEVANTGQLVQFVVTNYLLYLRVSGAFHLIVGVLHLFGFNLPPTNNLWLLAAGFTDYWRRINIYWKDFMMKVVYYPAFFSLRRLGPTTALVLATASVFVATTLLHSYQWFWLRGDLPLPLQDLLFWGILGLLVIVNAVWEARRGRKRSLGTARRTWGDRIALAGRTVGTLAIIMTLWSLWSSSSLGEWLAMWTVVGHGLAIEPRVGVTIGVAALAVLTSGPPGTRPARLPGSGLFRRLWGWREAPAVVAVMAVVLLLAGRPEVYRRLGTSPAYFIESLQHQRLNQEDQATLERGYYENLFAADRANPELWERYSGMPADWRNLHETEAARRTTDWRRLELVPNTRITYKGAAFSVNQWGLRDREYGRARPAGAYRVAVTGASTVMGSGVGDDETFEALLEDRLAGIRPAGEPAAELLNFAVESYNIPAQLAMIDRVIAFQPNAWWYIAHETEFDKSILDFADLIAREQVHDADLLAVLAGAGVTPGAKPAFTVRRLMTAERELVRWAYGKMVAEARSHGIEPVWIFIPMPVAGRGSPCPPGRQAQFCFGSITRPGAAADRGDPRVSQLFGIAEEAGFQIVDLSGVFDGHNLEALWISAWDGHPNREGHALVAERLFREVRVRPGLIGWSDPRR